MLTSLTRKSSADDVSSFLEENALGDIVKSFKDNEIDGEVFFDLEYRDILEAIPRLKARKNFVKVFEQVTGTTFDVDGKRCPLRPLVDNGKSSSAEENCRSVNVSVSHDVNSPGTSSSSEGSHRHEEKEVASLATPKQRKRSANETEINASREKARKRVPDDSDDDYEDEEEEVASLATPKQRKRPANETEINASREKARKRVPDDSDNDYEDDGNDSPVIPRQPPINMKKNGSNCKGKQPMNNGENEAGNLLKDFVLPTRWQPHVEQALKRGGPLSTAEKNTLVRQICDSIMGITKTIYKKEREHIAMMLVEKYPFLKGSFGAGHQMWAEKINERIWNLKRLASRNEKKRLKEEGVVVPKGQPGRKAKKASSELPPIIEGETKDTLESQRLELQKLWKTSPRDAQHIRTLMEKTFPLRRAFILKEDVRLWKILQDYPAFQDPKGNELKAELGRVLGNQHLVKEMKEKWDMKKPALLSALRSEKKQEIHSILFFLEDCDPADEKELEDRCILACLPHALGEKSTNKVAIGELFWHITTDKDDMDTIISNSTSPRLVSSGSLEQLDSLCLVAEGMVVCKFRANASIFNAVIALLGSFYLLNACFPIGSNGRSKNVYMFLEHFLINNKKQLPTGVENFAAALKL